MSYDRVMKDLKKGKQQPIYVLFGTEYYYMDHFNKAIEQSIDADKIDYDMREVSLDEAIADAETFPFFAEKKLIFVHHAHFLSAKLEKTTLEHDITALERYTNAPAAHAILILIAPYEKLDARKKVTKLLKKQAVMVDCNPAKQQNVEQMIQQMANQHDINIDQDAIDLLASEFEDNLFMLEKELEKLALYVGAENTVTKEIATTVISPSNHSNALQFVDAVLKNNLTEAIKIFKELEKMSEEPIGLIALLAFQFRITFRVKLMQEKGYSLDKMKSEINVHPYVVQLARDRSKYFSKKRLQAFIHYLTETDTLIKTGKMEKGIAFEMLLYQLTALER